jgi:tetratricopeptide (TPR) repeat protein
MQCFALRAAFSLLLFTGTLAACPVHGQAEDIDDLLEQARVAQSSGNYASAAGLYAHATELSPSTAELWANRGVMEYLAGQVDASTVSLKHALRLNPGLFSPMLFLGKAYVQLGKQAAALPWLNHAHTIQPRDVEVLITLAKANADLNLQRQAASLYADAVRAAPENQAAWLGLGAASLEVIAIDGGELAASEAQSIWARSLFADELFAQGRPLEAVDTYKAAVAAASNTQKAMLVRNLKWMQTHPDLFPMPAGSQEALQQLSAQLESGPAITFAQPCGHEATLLDDAACAYWAGDYEQTAAKASEELHRSGQNVEALYWSVKASERLAVAALSRYEQLAPQSATTYVMVGDLYRYQRQMESALSEYRKALAIDAHDPAALLGMVVGDLSANKLEEAAIMDRTALADRPLDPQLNLLMAEIFVAEDQYDQARPYLEKCLSSPPELQSRVHYLLGRADAEDGNTEEAIRQFEMASPGDKDGSAHYQLSRLYRKMGKVAQAQQAEAEAKVLIQHRHANAAVAVREATGLD